MSHQKARAIIKQASAKLLDHRSGNPEYELEPEKIEKLREEIEEAQAHLEEEPDDFEPTYSNRQNEV